MPGIQRENSQKKNYHVDNFVRLSDLPFSEYETHIKNTWVESVNSYISAIVNEKDNTSLGLYVDATNEKNPKYSIRGDLNSDQFNKLKFAYDLSNIDNISTSITNIKLNVISLKNNTKISFSVRLYQYLRAILSRRLESRLKKEYKKYINSDFKNHIFVDTLENIVGPIEEIISFILDTFSIDTNNNNKGPSPVSVTVNSLGCGSAYVSCKRQNCSRTACCSKQFCTPKNNTCKGSVCGQCCCVCIIRMGESYDCGCQTQNYLGCDLCSSDFAVPNSDGYCIRRVKCNVPN